MSQDSMTPSEFGALFEAHLGQLKTDFKIGDRIKGTVTAVDRNSVFVDIGARCDALIDRPELQDDQGQLKVKVGDSIEAFCVGSTDDGVRLTTRISGAVADASLMEAYESGIPVEGRVMAERKGGYEVQVASQSGFCPYSQMDIHRRDATAYLGERFTFVITEYDEAGGNLVVSRRRCLEQEQAKQREALRATLAEGALVDGVVTRLMPFGAFVDIGSGVEGLIHVSELGWGRGLKPEDVLAAGQTVKVSVTKLDWENQRIGLSLRHAQQDPWELLVGAGSPYVEGRRCAGVVTKLMPFGAFVELEPGVEGLLHVSRLGAGRRINHPSEVLHEGERVEVSIVTIDHETRRLSLSMETTRAERQHEAPPTPTAAAAPEPGGPVVKEGARLTGTVEGHRDFGVFVKLPDGQTGLLHISQLDMPNSANAGRALYRRFPPASTLEVVVLSIDGRRLSLTLPETLEREAERQQVSDFTDQAGGSLGSLDGVFGNLKLE
jgi:small subunit ribosomal protein S1